MAGDLSSVLHYNPMSRAAPALAGLMPKFADPAIEQRYLAAHWPQNKLLLGGIMAAATAAPFAALVTILAQPSTFAAGPGAWIPSALEALTCLLGLALLARVRGAGAVERVGVVFAVLYTMARCFHLMQQPDEVGAATVVAAVGVMYFGLPVRLPVLAPLMAAASGAMVAAWAIPDPSPELASIVQLGAWMWTLNLLALVGVRAIRRAMRGQWSGSGSWIDPVGPADQFDAFRAARAEFKAHPETV